MNDKLKQIADYYGIEIQSVKLADVLLMARQMEYLIDQRPEFREKIDKLMEAKIERQLKRMEEEKAK